MRIRSLVLSCFLSVLPIAGAMAAPANPIKVYPGDVDGGDGGSPFEDRCPDGSFLAGFQIGDGDQVIDRIRPSCAKYDTRLQRFRPRFSSSLLPHGGPTSAAREGSCPEGYFATGMWFGQTAKKGFDFDDDSLRPLDFVALQCKAIGPSDQVTVCVDSGQGCGKRLLADGAVGFVRLDYMVTCPEGEALVGIRGRTDKAVDALGGICSTTRPMQAAAEEIGTMCDSYAEASYAAAAQNQDLGCGFSGERWLDDRSFHLSWCWLPDNDRLNALNGEIKVRNRTLRQCDPGALVQASIKVGPANVVDPEIVDLPDDPRFVALAALPPANMTAAELVAVLTPAEATGGTDSLTHEGVAAIAKVAEPGSDAGASGAKAEAEDASGTTKAVAQQRVTIRSQGTSKSKALGSLNTGDEIDVVSCTGNWCEFQFQDGTAFVFKKYIGL